MEERQIILDPNTLKSIQINIKQAGKGVLHCIENGFLLDLPGFIKGGFEILRSIDLKKDIRYLAWQLIETALLNTFIRLVSERDQISEPNSVVVNMFNECVTKLLKNNDFCIDSQSFKTPGDLPFLPVVTDRLREYIYTSSCFGKDLSEQDTHFLLDDFKLRFIQEINNEFSQNKTEYSLLDEFFNPPFIENELLAEEWYKYRVHLMTLIDYPLFDNDIHLSNVYIQLRGMTYQKIKEKGEFGFVSSYNWKKQICIVDTYLLDWVKNGEKDNALKIISGGPGYGKSTILKNVASILAREGKNVFFIPLHLLNLNEDIDGALNRYFEDDQFFRSNPIVNTHKNILIFDGLDELVMQGNAWAEKAKSFLARLRQKIELVNKFSRNLMVIASGREIIVDQCRSELDDNGKQDIIQLLPYYISEELSHKEDLKNTINSDLRSTDQRNEWWHKFSSQTRKEIPYYIYDKKLEDLTTLPLLNCLLAIAIQSGFEYTRTTDLNRVYAALIRSVYLKEYPGEKRKKCIIKISFEEFLDIMSEIAYCAWLNNGRDVNVLTVQKHLEETGKLSIFKRLCSDLREGLNSLFVLFYFRSADVCDFQSQVFEFTHKSFTEYLTSINLSKTFTSLCKLYTSEDSDKEKVIDRMKQLFSRKDTMHDIKTFVSNELNEGDKDIENFVISFIKNTFSNDAVKGYGTMNSYDSYYWVLEEFLLFVYNKNIGKNVSHKIQIKDEHSLKYFLSRREYKTSLCFMEFCQQDCTCAVVESYFFGQVDLIHSYFKMIQMADTSFENSTFTNVTFFRSELKNCVIQDCTLKNGVFKNVVFKDLKINGSTLECVFFEDISFGSSKVTNSIFDSCTFKDIHYWGSLFSNCTFKHIDFTNVSFHTSYLISKKLSGNKFVNCKMSRKQLEYFSELLHEPARLNDLGFEIVE